MSPEEAATSPERALDDACLPSLESTVNVLDLKVTSALKSFSMLEARIGSLEEFRGEYVEMFRGLHRDLRATLDAVHRLVDDRLSLKLFVERAVNAAERAERIAAETNVLSARMLDHCAKNCARVHETREARESKGKP